MAADPLDQAGRDRLRRLAERLRPPLEEDAATELDRLYGVSVRGVVPAEQVATLRDHPSSLAERHRIDALLMHYVKTHRVSPEEAVRRFVREIAFTEFNRLTGIRMLEAAGLVRPALPGGEQNDGFQLFRRAFPTLCRAQEDGGYRRFLEFVYDEAHAVVQSGLFDRDGVHSLVRPSAVVLRACVEALTAPELDATWPAEETMGWLYQYFTPEEQRRLARDTKAGGSQAPRNAYELAFRNQFYTPDYVVRWLTDNTLGAIWRDSHPESRIAEFCPLLLPGRGGEAPVLQRAEDLRVLDPACGSGHFLLYAFDVLLNIYREQGVAPEAAVDAILARNLFGVDIDWRACQIAGFALSLKARKVRREGVLPRPHVVWAQPLPAETDQRNAVLASLGPTEQTIALRLWDAFEQAAEAGSLLRADEDLDAAVESERTQWRRAAGQRAGRAALPGRPEQVSFGDLAAYWGKMAERLRQALHGYWHGSGESGDGDAAEARDLFAADLSSGLDLLDVLRAKYHVVLMNPPFGDATVGSREYIAKHYPKTKGDLYTAFLERGLQWLEPGGALGALGPRTAYFLKTSTAFREEIVLTRQVAAFADLGINVLDTAKVEAAAIVVRDSAPDRPALFFRSLKTRDKVAHLVDSTLAWRTGGRPALVYEVDPSSLRDIPGSPFAYWVGDSLRRKFKELPPLEGHLAEVRQGLATADDGRFLRLWWEVPAEEIGRGRRWVPFAKGGEYSPYWDDLRLVVDWGDNGAAIRASGNARVQNVAYYFRPGLTFPRRTTSDISVRVLPEGSVFGDKGPSVFPIGVAPEALAAIMNSQVFSVFLAFGASAADQDPASISKSYEIGLVQQQPLPALHGDRRLTDYGRDAIDRMRSVDCADETTHAFVALAELGCSEGTLEERHAASIRSMEDRILASMDAQNRIDDIVAELYELSPSDRCVIWEEIEANPATLPAAVPLDWSDELFTIAYLTKDAVPVRVPDPPLTATDLRRAWLAGKRQKHRSIADLALLFGVHPSVIVEARRRLGLMRSEEFAAACHSLVSYCVGCAFGRWDVRVGQRAADTTFNLGDPFAPLPSCSPGMLQDAQGLPLSPVDVPPDYPLRPPLDGLLADDPSDGADIVRAVHRVLEVLFGPTAPGIEDEIRAALRVADLRTYLRQSFFAAHLKEYSASQRQAPIYWQLVSPERRYGLWIYYPRLNRDTPAMALGKFVEPKLTHETAVLADLRRQAAEPGTPRSLKRRLSDQEALVADLVAFRDSLRTVATNFDVDFNDGAVLNAAPLAQLMRWPKANEAAAALRRGEPAWSAAARRHRARSGR